MIKVFFALSMLHKQNSKLLSSTKSYPNKNVIKVFGQIFTVFNYFIITKFTAIEATKIILLETIVIWDFPELKAPVHMFVNYYT